MIEPTGLILVLTCLFALAIMVADCVIERSTNEKLKKEWREFWREK